MPLPLVYSDQGTFGPLENSPSLPPYGGGAFKGTGLWVVLETVPPPILGKEILTIVYGS